MCYVVPAPRLLSPKYGLLSYLLCLIEVHSTLVLVRALYGTLLQSVTTTEPKLREAFCIVTVVLRATEAESWQPSVTPNWFRVCAVRCNFCITKPNFVEDIRDLSASAEHSLGVRFLTLGSVVKGFISNKGRKMPRLCTQESFDT